MSTSKPKNFFAVLQNLDDYDSESEMNNMENIVDNNVNNNVNNNVDNNVMDNNVIENNNENKNIENADNQNNNIINENIMDTINQIQENLNNLNINNGENNKNETIVQDKKYTKEEYNKRPTFYYTINQRKYPIRAGGVMFYKKNDDNIELLMIHNQDRNRYEDFGGCTDEKDKSIEETIAREVEEESNGVFKKNDIIQRLRFARRAYCNSSKYLMYFVQVNNIEAEFTSNQFGDKETHDNISRTINWYPLEDVLKADFIQNLNPRVNNKYVIKVLENLYKIY